MVEKSHFIFLKPDCSSWTQLCNRLRGLGGKALPSLPSIWPWKYKTCVFWGLARSSQECGRDPYEIFPFPGQRFST